jgi:hypothetical protein
VCVCVCVRRLYCCKHSIGGRTQLSNLTAAVLAAVVLVFDVVATAANTTVAAAAVVAIATVIATVIATTVAAAAIATER